MDRSVLPALRSACWLALALVACSDDAGDGGGAAAAGGGGSVEPVSFATDIHPVLLAKCSGSSCHSVPMGPFRPGHAAAETDAAYAATQDTGLNGQPVYERILARTSSADPAQIMPPPYAMPPCGGAVGQPGCLSEDELELIETWVAQGAPP
jgi:hypothetical protein